MKLLKSLRIWMDHSIDHLMGLTNAAKNELLNLLKRNYLPEKLKIEVRHADHPLQRIKEKWLEKHQNQ